MDIKNLKLEDLYIIEEKPLRVKVGKRCIYIKSLPLKDVDAYERRFADILIKWANYIGNMSILDYHGLKTPQKVELFTIGWKRLLKKNATFKKDIIKLFCKPYHISPRYFRKHATYDLVTQCFLACQLINYDAVKKNIQYLLIKAGMIQASPGLLDSSQRSTDGAKRKRLTPRY